MVGKLVFSLNADRYASEEEEQSKQQFYLALPRKATLKDSEQFLCCKITELDILDIRSASKEDCEKHELLDKYAKVAKGGILAKERVFQEASDNAYWFVRIEPVLDGVNL